MNYDLAKKLKDAGFPQEGKIVYGNDTIEMTRETILVPTLPELIEACGNNFWRLDRGAENTDWAAAGHYPDDEYISQYGKTPEEAVANLWLALNEKS